MAAISFGLFSYYPRSIYAAQTGSSRSADFLSQLLSGAQTLSAGPTPAGSYLNSFGSGAGSSNNVTSSIDQLRKQLLNLRDAVSTAQQGRTGSAQAGAGGTPSAYETKYVFENRDVYETQPVYETQDVLGTIVNGTKNLSGYGSISAAGIDNGADLSIQVGSDAAATVKFVSSTKISVTVSGSTTNFTFSSSGGAWRTGLVNALNSISNLSASFDANGKLRLETSDAQSLTIADVANGFFDFSGSPLAPLGLTAGTTEASVVGTEQVQVGTKQVVAGQTSYLAEYQVAAQAVPVAATGSSRDDISRSVKDLVSAVERVLSSTGATPGAGGLTSAAGALANEVSALLQSPDFKRMAGSTASPAVDKVLSRIDGLVAKTDALKTQLSAAPSSQFDIAAALRMAASDALLNLANADDAAGPFRGHAYGNAPSSPYDFKA